MIRQTLTKRICHLPVNSPNFAELLHPPLQFRQLALYFLSSKRTTLHTQLLLSFFDRAWSTFGQLRSHNPVYCPATAVVALMCFFFSRLNGAFIVLEWCLQWCLNDTM